jgi:hypothetical protein
MPPGDVLQRTGGVYETTLPLSPRFRGRIREVAELSGDDHPPDPENTLFSDDHTMPEGDEYTIREE